MKVSIIVAHGNQKQIGLNNKLLWKLSSDLKKFKELTLHHNLIMGRKTFESIGRPLPGREIIIVTRNKNYPVYDHCVNAPDLFSAIQIAEKRGETEVFICGGGEIYKEALTLAHRLYVSHVEYNGPADTFFPDYEKIFCRCLVAEHFNQDHANEFNFTFSILERNNHTS